MVQTILHTGTSFRLVMRRTARGRRSGERRYLVQCTADHASPRGRRVSAQDVTYLLSCGQSFDAACVMDYGLGIWAA
jgi:hypothetical protein